MQEQLFFRGFQKPPGGPRRPPPPGRPPRPPGHHALFFALFPPRPAALRTDTLAWDLRHAHGLSGRPIGERRYHVSLFGVGRFEAPPDGLPAALADAASTVRARPFDLLFDEAQSFGKYGRRPLVLRLGKGLDPLLALRRKLVGALLDGGIIARASLAFVPHLTLLYDNTAIEDQPVEPIAWTARELTLVHSLVGQTLYLPLGRWRLDG